MSPATSQLQYYYYGTLAVGALVGGSALGVFHIRNIRMLARELGGHLATMGMSVHPWLCGWVVAASGHAPRGLEEPRTLQVVVVVVVVRRLHLVAEGWGGDAHRLPQAQVQV